MRRPYSHRILLSLVLLMVGLGTAVAQANKPYLALGDSIPFGFNPTATLGDLFAYRGYPQFVASALNYSLSNASCPGESSGSFFNVTAQDEGCHEYRAAMGPLFVTYSSLNQTQFNYAISFLRANPKTRLVTITIGGDDLLLLLNACSSQPNPSACELSGLGKVLADYAKNLTAAYLGIRVAAHYEGPIIAVNYFSPDYTNALETVAIGELNAVTLGITAAFGGKVADVFSAFQQASVAGGGLPCNVGLAFPGPVAGTCDVHPTVAGQEQIATVILQALK